MCVLKGTAKDVVMNETSFIKELRIIIESVGGVCFKIHGHTMQESGWPDLYIAHPFWTGWIEAKVGKRKTNPLQQDKMRKLIQCKVNTMTLRFNDGCVSAEWYNECICSFSNEAWIQKMGQGRAWKLFDFLIKSSAIINRLEGG